MAALNLQLGGISVITATGDCSGQPVSVASDRRSQPGDSVTNTVQLKANGCSLRSVAAFR